MSLIGWGLLIGLACVAVALVGWWRLQSWHGKKYPTLYRAGEGTYASPAAEARAMRRERLATRGGIELE